MNEFRSVLDDRTDSLAPFESERQICRFSICMATYNGARYVREQIESILAQMSNRDELVIVDDASSDATVDIVERCSDARIRLFSNFANKGVVGTFERAIREARGEIIFLSDQDDVWKRNKVARFMEVFEQRPDITLVLSDAEVIDAGGDLKSPSFFLARGKFAPEIMQNFFKNRYLGCTMAFRRQVAEWALPFPSDIPMHDMWIGMINELHGSTFFIDEPLISYRQHGGNACPNGGSMRQKIAWRWRLLKGLAGRMMFGPMQSSRAKQ